MTWSESINSQLSQPWAYAAIGSSGAGGRLSIRLGGFADPGGQLEIGIFANPQGSDRAVVGSPQKALIVPFARLLYFDLPPDIGGLAIGWRLASEADDRSLPLGLSWRIDAIASGGGGGGTITIPPPQGLLIAATLEQVTAAVDARRSVQIAGLEATLSDAIQSLALPDPDLVGLFNTLI
jgi:hypothetical protein